MYFPENSKDRSLCGYSSGYFVKRMATILLKLALRVVLHLNHMWFDYQENLTVKNLLELKNYRDDP